MHIRRYKMPIRRYLETSTHVVDGGAIFNFLFTPTRHLSKPITMFLL